MSPVYSAAADWPRCLYRSAMRRISSSLSSSCCLRSPLWALRSVSRPGSYCSVTTKSSETVEVASDRQLVSRTVYVLALVLVVFVVIVDLGFGVNEGQSSSAALAL